MPTLFKNATSNNIGIIPTEVLTTDSGNQFTIIGLNLANTTSSLIQVSVVLKTWTPDISGNNETLVSTGNILRNIMIPPQSSLKAITNGEKLIIAKNNSLEVSSNAPNSVDSVISYVEIL